MNEFYKILKEIAEEPHIKEMKSYKQHINTNSYHHSLHVAFIAYGMAKRLGWSIDKRSLIRGAMLHDFYLYDIEEMGYSAYKHGTSHAKESLHNAEKYYNLTSIEKDIIYSHMFPLNLTHLPHTKEAILVTLADKYCALKEQHFSKHSN